MGQIYKQGEDEIRDIVLTFDDGPNPETTPVLLDTLANYEIKALFFVVGKRLTARGGAAIAKRAATEGHIVGNHTFGHPNLRELGFQRIREEITRTHDLICDCVGQCNIFRPPYGTVNAITSQLILDLGYSSVLWNVDTLDWKYRREGSWVSLGMEQIEAQQKSIVLLHDIYRTTVEYVCRFIEKIRGIPTSRFVLY
jgi:peptidoglycan/xylan/chitin deacetylase (PgdA/CDA1 family)